MNNYYIGQQFKNSPSDDFPFFELIEIVTLKTNGTIFYRVRWIDDHSQELILHEEDLFPYATESENIQIVNENVQQFEEGETYIFLADKIEVRHMHKWADLVNKQLVDVKLQGLGIVTLIKNGIAKEMPVLPKFCVEIERYIKWN